MHTLEEQVAAINERSAALKPGDRFSIEDLPAAAYHQTNGYGSTAIKAAVRSMAHFWEYTHTPHEQTKDMLLGTLTHTMIFEPQRMDEDYVCVPGHLKPGNNNAWKQWKEEQTKTIVDVDDVEYCAAMANSVMDNLGQFFGNGTAEVSYWYRCPQTQLILKARADYIQGDAIIDLKTTRAISATQFAHICQSEYAIQCSLYRQVTGLADLIFGGVSKESPHQCYLAKQGKEVRVNAATKIAAALDAIVFAKEFNQYPLPPIEIIETQLRPWD